MAKIPGKPIANFVIKNGPRLAEHVVKNSHLIQPTADAINKIIEWRNNRPVPLLEQRLKIYNNEILPSLHHFNRSELMGYKLEVRNILVQLRADKKKNAKPKAVFHNKQSKKWEQVLPQIEVKLNARDYEEYLKLYHNPDSQSVYFKDHEQNMTNFKKLIAGKDSEKIREFLSKHTNMSVEDINRDFFLESS